MFAEGAELNEQFRDSQQRTVPQPEGVGRNFRVSNDGSHPKEPESNSQRLPQAGKASFNSSKNCFAHSDLRQNKRVDSKPDELKLPQFKPLTREC